MKEVEVWQKIEQALQPLVTKWPDLDKKTFNYLVSRLRIKLRELKASRWWNNRLLTTSNILIIWTVFWGITDTHLYFDSIWTRGTRFLALLNVIYWALWPRRPRNSFAWFCSNHQFFCSTVQIKCMQNVKQKLEMCTVRDDPKQNETVIMSGFK